MGQSAKPGSPSWYSGQFPVLFFCKFSEVQFRALLRTGMTISLTVVVNGH